MQRKIYKITCPKCEEVRQICQQHYSDIARGKRSTYCFKCYDRKRYKEYKIICPFCKNERIVNKDLYSKYNLGITKGLCAKCTEDYSRLSNKQEIITTQTIINESSLKIYKEKKALANYLWQSTHRDVCNAQQQRYYYNNIDYVRFLARIKGLKRRAISHVNKNVIEQIIKEHTINGIIFCYICRTECSDNYHIDHVVPIVRGGRNNKENLKIACSSCNLRKGAKDLEEFLDRNPYLKVLHIREEA